MKSINNNQQSDSNEKCDNRIQKSNPSSSDNPCLKQSENTLETTKEEQKWKELVLRYQQGEAKALEELMEGNMGLIRNLALSFRHQGNDLQLDDLVQEGAIALISAAQWFNPNRGMKFNTYAGTCIRKKLHTYLHRRKNRPLPLEVGDDRFLSRVPDRPIMRREEGADELHRCLQHLSPRDRMIVELRHGLRTGTHLKWKQIAKILWMHPDRLRRKYHRALIRLNIIANRV